MRQFVADASHELRTFVRGYTELTQRMGTIQPSHDDRVAWVSERIFVSSKDLSGASGLRAARWNAVGRTWRLAVATVSDAHVCRTAPRLPPNRWSSRVMRHGW